MFPSNIFNDVCPDYEYQTFDNLDVFVFKFKSGYGACVSKPAGHYNQKINVWELTPTKLEGDRWVVDFNNQVVQVVLIGLTEVEISLILNKIASLSGQDF